MNILKKIIIVILVPIFIHAKIQRVPGQPPARPIMHQEKQKPVLDKQVSQYLVTVQKINGNPKFNIQNYVQDDSNQENYQDSDESIERIEYGNWRD